MLIAYRIWLKLNLYSAIKNGLKRIVFVTSSLISVALIGLWWFSFWNIWHYWKDKDHKDGQYYGLFTMLLGSVILFYSSDFGQKKKKIMRLLTNSLRYFSDHLATKHCATTNVNPILKNG